MLWLLPYFVVVTAASPAGDAAPAGCAIAVLDFQKTKAAPETAKVLADALAIELAARTGCRIITASDIRSMADFEAVKQSMGCEEESSCLAELGGALGVDRVVTGDVVVLDKTSVVINARLANVKDASVAGRANVTSGKSAADVRAAAPRVAAALLGEAPPDGPPVAALVVGGSGVVVAAAAAVVVAVGEGTLANAGAPGADKEGALVLSRAGAAGVALGVVGVVVGAVLFVVGGDA